MFAAAGLSDVVLPTEAPHRTHIYNQFVIRVAGNVVEGRTTEPFVRVHGKALAEKTGVAGYASMAVSNAGNMLIGVTLYGLTFVWHRPLEYADLDETNRRDGWPISSFSP